MGPEEKEFENAMGNNKVVNGSSYDYGTAAGVVSGMDGNVWKSYADAEAAGFSNIRTPHEFLRGGDDKAKYGTYQDYLAAMYEKYKGATIIDATTLDSPSTIIRNGVKFYDDAFRTGFETVGNNYRVVDANGNKYRIESGGVVDNNRLLNLATDVGDDEVFLSNGQLYIKRNGKIYSIVKRTGTNGSEYNALLGLFSAPIRYTSPSTPPVTTPPTAEGTGTPSTPEVPETPTADGGAAEGAGSTAGGEISAAGDGNGGNEGGTGNTGGEVSGESGGGGSGGTGYTAEEFRALAKEWGKSEGIDYDAQRQEQITAAESEYARSLTTYGEKAEQLGQMGLTGSGFSDNLERDAYAAKQQALSEIEKNYRNNEEGLIAKYKEYLETNEIASKETQNKANAAVYDILAKNEGLSLGAVKRQLMALGYSESEADSAVATYRETTNAQYGTTIETAFAAGSLTSLPDKKTLDTMVAADQLTREEADAHLAKVQNELNKKCLLAVENESEAEKFLAGFGVTLEDGQNLSDVLFAKIDELHAAGQLTDAQYDSILLDNIKRDLTYHGGDVEAISEIAGKINLGVGVGTEENKQAAFAEVCKALRISVDSIKLDFIQRAAGAGAVINAPTLLLDGSRRISVEGESVKSPPATDEILYRDGNYLYTKDDFGVWYRFDLTKIRGNGIKTDEQKAGGAAAVASLFESKDTVTVLNVTETWGGQDGFLNKAYDNCAITVNGTNYDIEMDNPVEDEYVQKLNDEMKSYYGRDPKPGDALCFHGRIVVVCDGGALRYVKGRTTDSVTIPGVND